jgi:predicted peptidase
LAGAGDPSRVGAANDVPIWAFHGAKDSTIPLNRMNELVAALRSTQGHPMFTVVANGVHYDAKRAALHDPNFLPWIFAQRKGHAAVPFEKVAGPKDKRPRNLEKK